MTLELAIRAAYETFAGYRKPAAIQGCPCCWGSERARGLLEKPLRALSADDLSDYAASVFLTVGDVADFKYLLPRLLEIAVTTPGWWPSPEVLLGKLKKADWTSWPAAERSSVEDVLHAWFEALLRSPPSRREPLDRQALLSDWRGDELLCGIALAGLDLRPYLEQLLEPGRGDKLRALYWMNFDGKRGRVKLRNPFWSGDREAGGALLAFLERPEVEVRAAL